MGVSEFGQTDAVQPWVSVIVPIYNGEADVADLVACLWAQTYPAGRVEYLLVDNNSGDRTFAKLRGLSQASSERGITLMPLREPHIQSSYAARNVGIRAAQGTILAFTDADCRPQPEWLQQLVQPFENPDVGIVAGEVIALPGTTWLEAFADRQDTLSQTHTLSHPYRPYGQTANLAVRREALQQAGLFRPYLTTGGDADLCWRILALETWTIQFAERAIVQHRHRSTLAELRNQWRRYGRSNRYLHDLHGVVLMRDLTWRDYTRRGLRWLGKEVPLTAARRLQGKADWVTLLETPLSLMCAQARSHGQRHATLPERADQIDWLDQ